MEASIATTQLTVKSLSPRLPRQAGTYSVECDFDRCRECDALVHWVPIDRSGRDVSHVPEMERPCDLRPWRCDCRCHAEADE